jgi:hypothetical protein
MGLLDDNHRIRIGILADGPGLYAIQASAYREQPFLGITCRIDEACQRGDEATLARCLAARLTIRAEGTGQDLDLSRLRSIVDA